VAHASIIATAGYAAFGGPMHLGRALGTWYQVPYFNFGRPYSYQRYHVNYGPIGRAYRYLVGPTGIW